MPGQEIDQGPGLVTDVFDLGRRPLEHDRHVRVGDQRPLEAGDDMDLRPLHVDLDDVDTGDVGQEVVESQGLDLDHLLGVAETGQGVGADGADTRVAGEVLTQVELQFRRLGPRGALPRGDVAVIAVDDHVAKEQLRQARVRFHGDHGALATDETGGQKGEVSDVGADVDEDLARLKSALQPFRDVRLPQAVEDEPGGEQGIAGVDQHLRSPAGGHQRRVVAEVDGSVGVAVEPGQPRLDGVEPSVQVVESERSAHPSGRPRQVRVAHGPIIVGSVARLRAWRVPPSPRCDRPKPCNGRRRRAS